MKSIRKMKSLTILKNMKSNVESYNEVMTIISFILYDSSKKNKGKVRIDLCFRHVQFN